MEYFRSYSNLNNPSDKFTTSVQTVSDLIGNTPLIEIGRLTRNEEMNSKIYAKAEWLNPGGSIKDRPALSMIQDGITNGKLTNDKIIIDASSGNTGIALAMLGSSMGFNVTLCLPKNVSKERISLIEAYGADIVFTDPLEGTDGAILKVREIVLQNPEIYYYIDQYNNEANWKAHYNSTAEEILKQTEGEITHFVAGIGTSGTFIGISKKLKEKISDITCISVQPNNPLHGLEGLKHMESSIKPGIYNENIADYNIRISTRESYEMTKRLARMEGLMVGISSGAALCAALRVGKKTQEGSIVTVFPDRGERYLGDKFWEETL